MRRLMWFSMGFGFACGLWAWGRAFPGLIALGLWAAFALAGIKYPVLKKAACALLGCALALFWCAGYENTVLQDPADLDGETRSVSIRITDFGFDTTYGTAADGILDLNGKDCRVRIYLREKQALSPGQMVEGSFRFSLTTPSGADTYHAGEGIFLLAYQEGDVKIRDAETVHWLDRVAQLRYAILEILETCFPEDTAPFARALLLGDTWDLGYETDTSFKVSGIRHVVAVSGLHVSILFALLSTVTFHRRFLTALVGMPVLFLFAALAGFTPSVNRACIMAGLMLLALLVNRQYDGPTALAFAALTMLVWNPLVITSISFQLSVASVAGIFLFRAPIDAWLMGKLGKKHLAAWWFATSVSISLSAMVLTAPLTAFHFHTVSLVGVLTNLLTLWLISFLFYGIMAVCLLSLLWTGGAVMLAWLLSWPIRYILVTAKILSKFPLAAVYTRSPYITAWLVFVYILLAVYLLSRNKKPLTLGCCAVLGLCFALLASWAEPMLYDAGLTVLDVGQGQSLILESRGRTYLVDCGGSGYTADLAAETLLSRGVTRLDGLILTHLDWDHAGSAADLLSRVDTDLLILPPIPGETDFPTGGETVYASRDLKISFDKGTISVYPPRYPGTGNENSLCVLFDTEKCDILITGDRDGFGERSLLRSADIPKVDVLLAGHHGSAYSTCDELLRAVRPDIVCISAGKNNPYGHPAPDLIKRLQDFGCKIYRTDQNGTIIIRR